MEFPRDELERLAQRIELFANPFYADKPAVLRAAVKAYDQLAERCVMDATEASLTIAELRSRIHALEEKHETA